MSIKSLIAAVAVAASMAVPASALTITSIDGDWQNATPSVSGEGTSSIRWGTDAGYGQSGYDFTAAPTNLDVPVDTQFSLGTFTHLNIPIRDTVLSSVELAVTFTINGLASAITTVATFDHYETPNHLRSDWSTKNVTCADGNANGTGNNVNGCADRVTASSNPASSHTFDIGGGTYFLDILGFFKDGMLLTDFWTVERQINTAELYAVFRTVSAPPPPSEVPLPASGFLLLAGLAGLFAKRRFG